MIIREIQEFAQIRYKARAYMCYLFSRNIPNKLPGVSKQSITSGFEKMAHEIDNFEAFYILDKNGIQIDDNISVTKDHHVGKGDDRSNRAYYYRAVREKRCVLTDPYPSSLTNDLCVTASVPIYDDNKELKFIACADIALYEILKLTAPNSIYGYFGKFTKTIYSLFAIGLFMVVLFLFYLGIKSLWNSSIGDITVEEMFEATIILTLALAIFDLVKAIFEEEVLGQSQNKEGNQKTMVRFLASIIIALAIEALMLVFKFSITAPDHILYAVYLIGGVAILIISLSIYIHHSKKEQE